MDSQTPDPDRNAVPAPAGRRLLAWIRLPSTWAEIAGVAAVVLAAAVAFQVVFGRPPTPQVASPTLALGTVHRLMSLPARPGRGATLDIAGARSQDMPTLEEGAAVGLSFQIGVPARVLVIEDRADVRMVLLYPRAGDPAAPIPAGERVQITGPGGGPLVITEPRGTRRVRLFLFPPDVDPLTLQPTELARIERQLTIVERFYRAERRGEVEQ